MVYILDVAYPAEADVSLAAIEVDDEEQGADVDSPLDQVLPAQIVQLGVEYLDNLSDGKAIRR